MCRPYEGHYMTFTAVSLFLPVQSFTEESPRMKSTLSDNIQIVSLDHLKLNFKTNWIAFNRQMFQNLLDQGAQG